MGIIKYSTEKISLFFFLISLPVPYLNGVYGTSLIGIYIIPFLISLILVLVDNKFKFYINFPGFVLICILWFFNTISSFQGGSSSTIFQATRYAFFSIYLLFVLPPIVFRNMEIVSKTICYISTLFAFLGFVSIISNSSVNLGIISIRKYYDFRFFGYWVPSTSSIFWNTNYFGVYQSVSLPFVAYCHHLSKKSYTFILIIINLLSIFFSGSRSAVIISIIYVLSLLIINKKIFGLNGTVFSLIIGFIILFFRNTLKNLLLDFILGEKGLNGRDILIDSVMKSLESKYFFGYGYGGVGDALIKHGSYTTTTQNMYLTYLLTGGITGALIVSIIILFTTFKFFTNKNKRRSDVFQVYFSVFLIVLIDGLVRSYSIGGLAFISALLTLSIGILWLPENLFFINKDCEILTKSNDLNKIKL